MAKRNETTHQEAPVADNRNEIIIRPSLALRNVATVRTLLETIRKTPEAVMAKSGKVDVERLLALGYICVRRNRDLMECTQASYCGALVKCIQYGLYPDERGHCYLIPRRTGPDVNGEKMYECHFQIGYQGLCELSRRTREIAKIEARVVYENDMFEYQYGLEPKCEHRPIRALGGKRGNLSAVYAIAWLRTCDQPTFVVLEKEDIDAIKKSAYITPRSPWRTHEPKMWMKSAVIQVTKLLPMSTELAEATALDELSSAGLSQNLTMTGQQEEPEEARQAAIEDRSSSQLGVEDLMGGVGDRELEPVGDTHGSEQD